MKRALLVAAAFAALTPILATADFAKSEDAIRYRQSALFILSQNFGRIGAMVNDKVPFDAAVAKESAAIVSVIGHLPWTAFGPGTDKGANTKARAEIWSQPDKFVAAQERLTSTLPKLTAAAQTGDKATLKAAFGDAAGACKNCHDSFRAR